MAVMKWIELVIYIKDALFDKNINVRLTVNKSGSFKNDRQRKIKNRHIKDVSLWI